MNNQTIQFIRELYDWASEKAQDDSHKIFKESKDNFKEQLFSGKIQMAVDRGLARQFLQNVHSEELIRPFAITLRRSRRMLHIILYSQLVWLITLTVLFILVIGWWTVLVFPIILFLVWKSWRSSQIPKLGAKLPKFLIGFFAMYSSLAVTKNLTIPHFFIGIVGILLFSLTIAMYTYPMKVLKKLVIGNLDLIPILIDANVVWLRKADY